MLNVSFLAAMPVPRIDGVPGQGVAPEGQADADALQSAFGALVAALAGTAVEPGASAPRAHLPTPADVPSEPGNPDEQGHDAILTVEAGIVARPPAHSLQFPVAPSPEGDVDVTIEEEIEIDDESSERSIDSHATRPSAHDAIQSEMVVAVEVAPRQATADVQEIAAVDPSLGRSNPVAPVQQSDAPSATPVVPPDVNTPSGSRSPRPRASAPDVPPHESSAAQPVAPSSVRVATNSTRETLGLSLDRGSVVETGQTDVLTADAVETLPTSVSTVRAAAQPNRPATLEVPVAGGALPRQVPSAPAASARRFDGAPFEVPPAAITDKSAAAVTPQPKEISVAAVLRAAQSRQLAMSMDSTQASEPTDVRVVIAAPQVRSDAQPLSRENAPLLPFAVPAAPATSPAIVAPFANVAKLVNAPVLLSDAPGLPGETAQQLVQAIRLEVIRGGGEAHIKLEPRHFGEVTVSVRVEAGQVTARVQAESPAVREWLQTNQNLLRDGLSDQRLTLDRLEVAEPQESRAGERQRGDASRKDEQPAKRQRRDEPTETFEVIV